MQNRLYEKADIIVRQWPEESGQHLSELRIGADMNSDTIGAGIVTFNPDIGRLKENIDAILPQVSELVIVDNGSANVDEVCDMIESYGSIYMVWNEENQGIAKALNQIVEFADSHKWQWVLTLDQDSVVMAGLIDNYRKYMDFDKTAMITCLFLDRNDLKQGLKTILTAIEKVKSGISICIFPEGTRNKNEDELDMLPFHEGSFKIAAKTNCPIIPMAISGSADIWENHFPRVKKTHVILEYGKPIYMDQLEKEDKKHLGAYTQNIIHEMLVKNKAQL